MSILTTHLLDHIDSGNKTIATGLDTVKINKCIEEYVDSNIIKELNVDLAKTGTTTAIPYTNSIYYVNDPNGSYAVQATKKGGNFMIDKFLNKSTFVNTVKSYKPNNPIDIINISETEVAGALDKRRRRRTSTKQLRFKEDKAGVIEEEKAGAIKEVIEMDKRTVKTKATKLVKGKGRRCK